MPALSRPGRRPRRRYRQPGVNRRTRPGGRGRRGVCAFAYAAICPPLHNDAWPHILGKNRLLKRNPARSLIASGVRFYVILEQNRRASLPQPAAARCGSLERMAGVQGRFRPLFRRGAVAGGESGLEQLEQYGLQRRRFQQRRPAGRRFASHHADGRQLSERRPAGGPAARRRAAGNQPGPRPVAGRRPVPRRPGPGEPPQRQPGAGGAAGNLLSLLRFLRGQPGLGRCAAGQPVPLHLLPDGAQRGQSGPRQPVPRQLQYDPAGAYQF